MEFQSSFPVTLLSKLHVSVSCCLFLKVGQQQSPEAGLCTAQGLSSVLLVTCCFCSFPPFACQAPDQGCYGLLEPQLFDKKCHLPNKPQDANTLNNLKRSTELESLSVSPTWSILTPSDNLNCLLAFKSKFLWLMASDVFVQNLL